MFFAEIKHLARKYDGQRNNEQHCRPWYSREEELRGCSSIQNDYKSQHEITLHNVNRVFVKEFGTYEDPFKGKNGKKRGDGNLEQKYEWPWN